MPASSSQERLARWRQALRGEGYRLTPARQAVLQVLAESQQALDATQIFDRARQRYAHLGLVTVYRTLETMLALGLVQRVHCPSQCARYVATEPGHQHLLVCRGCGRVWYFEGDDLDALMQAVAGESGFSIEEHWLQLIGLCEECRRDREEASPRGDEVRPCGGRTERPASR